MDLFQTQADVWITPQGALRDEAGTFASGNGAGLLELVRTREVESPPVRDFFRRLFVHHVRTLAAGGEPAAAVPEADAEAAISGASGLAALFVAVRPDAETAATLADSAPPMTGAEYFDGSLLLRFFREFDQTLLERHAAAGGDFTSFIRSLSPDWDNVGKVTFHLAENKGDTTGTHPFAFMASFVYRADGTRPRHLPLAAALKAYAGHPRALSAVLAPIQAAAQKSAFLRDQVESRHIFQPAAWTGREAYAFLRDMPIFEAADIRVRIANLWKGAPPKAKVSVALDVAAQSRLGVNSLLNFSVTVSLGGETLTNKELEELLNSTEGGLVRIRGQWVEADPEKIRSLLTRWREAERLARSDGISLAAGLRLLAGQSPDGSLAGAGDAATADADFCEMMPVGRLRQLLADIREPGAIELPPLPRKLAGVLRPYQTDGVKYLWRTSALGLGSCLADDMGLGKTLQLLSVMELWKKEGLLRDLPVLLVLPATLLANWRAESEKFTPGLRLVTLHASALPPAAWKTFTADPAAFLAPYDLALVTYGMLPRLPQLAELSFPAVIADEAQAIKNPATRQSRALRHLRSPRRIALTGTPVENRLADLWSLFDFVNPGLLGNLRAFMNFTKRLDGDYTPLRHLTRPFILRRLKTDKRVIADLPDKTEVKVYCSLTKRQAALYANCVLDLKEALQNPPPASSPGQSADIRRHGLVLGALLRFKQICNHPAQYLGDGDYAPELAGKFLRLSELVESIASRQEKALVFTQFREMTGPLHDHLARCFGRPGLILHGGTPVKERARLVAEFQSDDGPPFFVLSLKAAGVGLNLTAATHVIHFDRWWNPAVENQATDRAFRIGQKKNVLVHKFICSGTLEEKIDALMTDKQRLSDDLLSEGAEKLVTNMSNDEVLNLVKLDINQMET